ncbi:MAG: 50S ribosomal protein L33 [Oligoflexia bacterium]|nr:50S ribosomal protein L33 [Oligoflexia bacterium]MBF0366066.1 50S ribosomal protein L33 [Oligoflexia bacterium]
MAKGNRVIIHLQCTSCPTSNMPGVNRYSTTKNKKTTPDRLEMKKYCKFERKHTVHKESK